MAGGGAGRPRRPCAAGHQRRRGPGCAAPHPGGAVDHDAGRLAAPGSGPAAVLSGVAGVRRYGVMSESHSVPDQYILTLSCPDKQGIVHAVSSFLFMTGCNIEDSQQFGDRDTKLFFMRVHFRAVSPVKVEDLRASFAAVGDSFGMDWQIHRADQKMRVVLMVSKFGHCLNDLLFRSRIGALPVEIAAVVSNHTDFQELVGSYGVPFRHIPVTKDTKAQAEAELLELVRAENVELVVLARYMQVLSDDLCKQLSGRIINIHHSFLPSFKGAKPVPPGPCAR
ncbi:formyltetrahydrofolate deformylase, partial [Streptomyces himastatinicus ATCC 53653]